MNRDGARERLRELCRLEDDWFTLAQTDEPDRFTVEAGFGGGADVYLAERWVEVCAVRPLERLMQAAGESVRGRGALLCATMLPRDPRRVAFRGRVYLDGFTEHAFFVMAGEVLQLAGPATDQEPVERPGGGSLVVPEADSAGAAIEEVAAFDEVAPPLEAETVAAVPEQIESFSTPTPAEPPWPEPQAPEPMGTIVAASEPDPRRGGVADTHPGLRVMPVEESVSEGRPAPVMAEPLPPEREITPTVQIPRGGAMPEPEAPPVAGPRPCPVCGGAVQPGERFCIGCGAQIPPGFFDQPAAPRGWNRPGGPSGGEEPDALAAPAGECPHCHFVNPAGNRFCQGCGSRLAG